MILNVRQESGNILTENFRDNVQVNQRQWTNYSTTKCERVLLAATIVVLPLEDHIPTVGGFSIAFLLFSLLACYTFVYRSRALGRIWLHPVFRAAYILLMVGFLIESAHENSSYSDLLRLAMMIVGGVLYASLCRDKAALQAAVYSYMLASLWLSALLFLTTYGTLQSSTANDYHGASAIRAEAAERMGLEGNLNSLAFLTTQGGVVALSLALAARFSFQRGLFMAISLFCLVGSFLLMSRTGLVIIVGACTTVLMTYRTKRARALLLAIILIAAFHVWVPDVVFSRMDVTVEGGRTRAYWAAVENLPEYFLVGVGAGNFWSRWRFTSSFDRMGAHNVYIQVTVNWGLMALIALFGLVFQAYRCIPRSCANDGLALCLPGLAMSCLLMLLFAHTFYDKWYSFGLGLLVAARFWIWPTGTVLPAPHPKPARSPTVVSVRSYQLLLR
jgi:hypothetical protein